MQSGEVMMSDNRKLVSQAELSEILTSRLRAFEDCADCSASVRYTYPEPDGQGCNWSPDVTIRLGANASKEIVAGIVSKLVEELRTELNVSK
jgi:hypothetical protein